MSINGHLFLLVVGKCTTAGLAVIAFQVFFSGNIFNRYQLLLLLLSRLFGLVLWFQDIQNGLSSILPYLFTWR